MTINLAVVAASGSVAFDTEGTQDWLAPSNAASPAGPLRALNPVPPSKVFGGGEILLGFDWLRLGGAATAFSNSGGITKTSAAADNVQGAALSSTSNSGFFHLTIINYGFRIRVPADFGSRTLNIYTSQFSGTVTLKAQLMDGSEAAQTITHGTAGVTTFRKWSVTYVAASVTEMVVTVLLTAHLGSTPNLLFSGATLGDFVAGGVGGIHVEITSAPGVHSPSSDATFEFTITDGDAEYSIDGAGYLPAVSPLVFTGLAAGEHLLMIRSVEEPTLKQGFTWTVDEGAAEVPEPPIVPTTYHDAIYLGHVADAIARLPSQFKKDV